MSKRLAEPVAEPASIYEVVYPVYTTQRGAVMAANMLEAIWPDYTAKVEYRHALQGWVCNGFLD